MDPTINQLNGLKRNGESTKEPKLLEIRAELKALSQEIKKETSTEVYERLGLKIRTILNDLEHVDVLVPLQAEKLYEFNTKDKIFTKNLLFVAKTRPGNYLPNKIFTPRNSLITDLWDNKHIGTIYHIFLAMLFGLFINTIVHDLVHKGTMKLGLDLIIASFGNIHKVLYIWMCMFITTTINIHFGVYIWTKVRKTTQYYVKWDKFCCILYIVHLFGFAYYFTSMVVHYQITTAEAIGVLTEMTRFLMKSHAFVRSNVPSIMKHNQTKEFSRFLYFMFAPTLVYQDTYPRSKDIKWKYVMICFIEVLGCIVYISFLFERFLVPDFEHFGLIEHKWQNIILMILGNGIAGTLVLLCTFYALLHSWHNGFAEMLRFADRLFYKDWWTSTSFGRWYTTWNVVVHDWLYTYIYKDFYEIIIPNKKFLAKFMVFFVSALFHEFILGFGFGFCFPILFILFFVFGLAMSCVRIKYELIGNFGLWYSLSLGMGIAMSAYCMEFYARINCPAKDVTVISYFIPKSIFGCTS